MTPRWTRCGEAVRRNPTRTLTLTLAAALAFVLPGVAAAAEGKPPAEQRVEDLAWLTGHWSGEVKGAGSTTRFESFYTTPEGGMILSVSKAFGAGGKVSWFELERFDIKDGILRMTPYPGGRASDPFPLVEHDAAAKKAVFANPQHDFPKRISYQQNAPDRLYIVLTGDPGGPVMEFTLSRVP